MERHTSIHIFRNQWQEHTSLWLPDWLTAFIRNGIWFCSGEYSISGKDCLCPLYVPWCLMPPCNQSSALSSKDQPSRTRTRTSRRSCYWSLPRKCTFSKPEYFLAWRMQNFGQFWLFCCKFTHFLVYFCRPKYCGGAPKLTNMRYVRKVW